MSPISGSNLSSQPKCPLTLALNVCPYAQTGSRVNQWTFCMHASQECLGERRKGTPGSIDRSIGTLLERFQVWQAVAHKFVDVLVRHAGIRHLNVAHVRYAPRQVVERDEAAAKQIRQALRVLPALVRLHVLLQTLDERTHTDLRICMRIQLSAHLLAVPIEQAAHVYDVGLTRGLDRSVDQLVFLLFALCKCLAQPGFHGFVIILFPIGQCCGEFLDHETSILFQTFLQLPVESGYAGQEAEVAVEPRLKQRAGKVTIHPEAHEKCGCAGAAADSCEGDRLPERVGVLVEAGRVDHAQLKLRRHGHLDRLDERPQAALPAGPLCIVSHQNLAPVQGVEQQEISKLVQLFVARPFLDDEVARAAKQILGALRQVELPNSFVVLHQRVLGVPTNYQSIQIVTLCESRSSKRLKYTKPMSIWARLRTSDHNLRVRSRHWQPSRLGRGLSVLPRAVRVHPLRKAVSSSKESTSYFEIRVKSKMYRLDESRGHPRAHRWRCPEAHRLGTSARSSPGVSPQLARVSPASRSPVRN
eukprot:5183147-Pleurochrysis_carterae.AAC.2